MPVTGTSKADNAFCQVLSKHQAYTLKKKKSINQSIKLAFLVILYLVADNRLGRALIRVDRRKYDF